MFQKNNPEKTQRKKDKKRKRRKTVKKKKKVKRNFLQKEQKVQKVQKDKIWENSPELLTSYHELGYLTCDNLS